MIQIDYQDSRPIYEQIAEKYKTLILKGALLPDEKMPSVRQLSMQLSANPNTVQRAYSELERQGFIYTVKGKGNFVRGDSFLREERLRELRQALLDLIAEAGEVGISPEELFRGIPAGGRNTASEGGETGAGRQGGKQDD
jgi:GntR family transcriptional regulator